MPRSLRFTLYVLFIFLTACSSSTPIPLSTQSSPYVFRFNPPALLEYDSNFTLAREIPINLPCPLTATHAAPNGGYLALEIECTSGPLVLVVDTLTGEVTTPFTDVDSHFLAWDLDNGLYLRVDTLGNTRLMRVVPNGPAGQFPLTAIPYDMDFAPDDRTLLYAFTRGLGLGSELWTATSTGRNHHQLHNEPDSILTFARWSPDGQYIAFINMPDSSTPFPLGELWVMDADGSNAHFLASADAGHGYAPAWSPDSTRIAYVGRENPNDASADQAASALVSNIHLLDIATGQSSRVTRFEGALAEAPVWSADGHYLAFTVITQPGNQITVWVADLASGEIKPLDGDTPTCCPAWMRSSDPVQ